MRTIEIQVYSFDELSEKAQQRAIQDYRNGGVCDDYIWNEAKQTVMAFHEIFPTKTGNRSWLDVNTDYIDDNVLELSGLRLQKYLWNNFKSDLFLGKYIGNYDSQNKVNHKRIESKWYKNSNKWGNYYHSGITLNNDCVLTGICYDDCLLKPLYEFLSTKDVRNDGRTYGDLLKECFENLSVSIDKEIAYLNSDEAIIENIKANNYEFEENGDLI